MFPMGWEYSTGDRGSEWHEGYLVAEFEDGLRALGISGTGIPIGHLAVDQYGDGTFGHEAVRRHGGQPEFATRPAGEVIGWRAMCNCYGTGDTMPTKHWVSQQLWTRVPSPLRHDPGAFRIYAADEDVLDVISGDANTAAHDVWWNEHINDVDAEAAITTALAAIRAGEQQLDRAVMQARTRQLSWAKIGAAAGMSPQAAHERWADRAREAADTDPSAEPSRRPRREAMRRDATGESEESSDSPGGKEIAATEDPMSNRRTTYRLAQGFRAGLDEPPMRQRLSGDPEWHLYDDHAVHLASFKGDSSDAIKGAMREVMDRGDFGTGDWFLVDHGEYEFRLND
jgi:hypothetical protein